MYRAYFHTFQFPDRIRSRTIIRPSYKNNFLFTPIGVINLFAARAAWRSLEFISLSAFFPFLPQPRICNTFTFV